MTRYFRPIRDERWSAHPPDKASSLNPFISRNPDGPEIRAMSFHFSYRFKTSRGAELSCLSTRRCSSIRHIPYCGYAKKDMSSAEL